MVRAPVATILFRVPLVLDEPLYSALVSLVSFTEHVKASIVVTSEQPQSEEHLQPMFEASHVFTVIAACWLLVYLM